MSDNVNLREIPQSEETVFDGLIIHVNHMQVTLPNGNPAKREKVCHNGGAAIIPIDENENIYMVQQHRVVVDEVTLEIPAGKLEYPGADFRDAAIRELEEETGLRAESVELLTSSFPTPGYSNEIIGVYMATGLSQHEDHPDPDEFLHVEKIPLKEAVARVMTGEFRDAKTIIGILMAWYRLHGYEAPVKQETKHRRHLFPFLLHSWMKIFRKGGPPHEKAFFLADRVLYAVASTGRMVGGNRCSILALCVSLHIIHVRFHF